MPTIKERCTAVVRLDRAEDAVDTTRKELTTAARAGTPVTGYWIAYRVALRALTVARCTVSKMGRR